MKRIAAHIGLTTFCALAVAFYLPENITAVTAGVFAVAAVLLCIFKKTRKHIGVIVIVVTAALSFGVNLAYTALAVKPVVDSCCGEDQNIEATLTDETYKQYGKYYYRLTTDTVNGENVHTKILLKTNRPIDIEPFEKISFTSNVIPTVNNYYLSKGYYITVDAFTLRHTVSQEDDKPLYYHAIRLRQAMRDAIETFLPEAEASLCSAVLIGDKYALDQSVKDDFRVVGASHFVVVSGMHFAILCMLSLGLFRKLFRRRYIYYPLTYLVIILYMMITGFQPSVMRSGIMMLILMTGRWAMRQTDSLTSLGVAGFLMPFIFTPYGCGDIGMILSFAATFAIIVWADPIYAKLRIRTKPSHLVTGWLVKGVNYLISLISVCLSANILAIPLSVFLFNGFSLMTLLSSLVLYPLIWLIMAFSLGVCVFCYLGPLRYLALLLSWPLYGLTKLTLFLVQTIASIPFAYIHVKSVYFYVWTAVTLCIGITAYLLRKRYRLLPYAALLSAILFLSGMIVNTVVQLNTNTLTYCAGKEGCTVYLNYCGRIHMLRFDCDSDAAYQMMMRLTDDYGSAQSAVCVNNRERMNYSRMSDSEFDIRHYLVYDETDEIFVENEPEERFGGDSVFFLDDSVTLNTIEDNGKELLYLTDHERSVMLIPAGYRYDSIPEQMRDPDMIVMSKPAKAYERLSCDTLILCSDSVQKEKLPCYNSLYTSADRSVNLKLN